MASVDIPNDVWEFLVEHARRKRRNPKDLLTKILADYRTRETSNRSSTLALKGYGVRSEERKARSH
jgi:hypothetical protein